MRRLLNTPVILGVILLLPLLALGCSSSSDDEGGGAAASGALDGSTRAVQQAQQLEDCGPDEECLRTAIGNCDSAKGKLQSVSEGYGLEFYVESRGVDGEDCVYYYKVVTAIGPTEPPEGLRQQVGKDMVCAIPQAIIVKPEGLIVYPIEPPQRVLLELCEGPLIDAAMKLGAVVTVNRDLT